MKTTIATLLSLIFMSSAFAQSKEETKGLYFDYTYWTTSDPNLKEILGANLIADRLVERTEACDISVTFAKYALMEGRNENDPGLYQKFLASMVGVAMGPWLIYDKYAYSLARRDELIKAYQERDCTKGSADNKFEFETRSVRYQNMIDTDHMHATCLNGAKKAMAAISDLVRTFQEHCGK